MKGKTDQSNINNVRKMNVPVSGCVARIHTPRARRSNNAETGMENLCERGLLRHCWCREPRYRLAAPASVSMKAKKPNMCVSEVESVQSEGFVY